MGHDRCCWSGYMGQKEETEWENADRKTWRKERDSDEMLTSYREK